MSVKISGCYGGFIILNKFGEVYSIGKNNFFQLGQKDKKIFNKITKISLENVVDIGAANFQSIYVLKDGTVFVSGWNQLHVLGDPNFGIQIYLEKMKIPNDSPMKEVSVGSFHSFLISKDQKIYCCGSNEYQQLGLKKEIGECKNLILNENISFITPKMIKCGCEFTIILSKLNEIILLGNIINKIGDNLLILNPDDLSFSNQDSIKIEAGRNLFLILVNDNLLYYCGEELKKNFPLKEINKNENSIEIFEIKENGFFVKNIFSSYSESFFVMTKDQQFLFFNQDNDNNHFFFEEKSINLKYYYSQIYQISCGYLDLEEFSCWGAVFHFLDGNLIFSNGKYEISLTDSNNKILFEIKNSFFNIKKLNNRLFDTKIFCYL